MILKGLQKPEWFKGLTREAGWSRMHETPNPSDSASALKISWLQKLNEISYWQRKGDRLEYRKWRWPRVTETRRFFENWITAASSENSARTRQYMSLNWQGMSPVGANYRERLPSSQGAERMRDSRWSVWSKRKPKETWRKREKPKSE